MEMLEWYRKKDSKAALVTGENAPGNNQMSSPMVQKDLVRACAEETSELTKSEIGDRCFAVLVDEARDASIKEQMAVVVRFVNDKGSVIERFLGIEHVSNTTSTSLKEALDTMLRRYGLSISKIRGQGYDGASNMRGQFHGLQRLVTFLYSLMKSEMMIILTLVLILGTLLRRWFRLKEIQFFLWCIVSLNLH
ncbi:hypothetical protein SEVIR_6G022432v4 [Setaria viridis]